MNGLGAATGSARQRRPGLANRTGALLCILLLGYTEAVLLRSGIDIVSYATCVAQYAYLAGWAGALTYFVYRCLYSLDHLSHISPREAERWLLIAAAATTLMFPAFAVFKQLILPEHGFFADRFLARMGWLALGGHAPWHLTHAIFGSLAWTLIIDRLYSFWLFPFFMFPMLSVILAPTEKTRAQMLLAWVLALILIGSLGALIFASAGPCYFTALIGPNPGFAALNDRLAELNREAHAIGTQLNAVDFQDTLLARYRARSFAAAGGISAMPSMHVAIATLLAVAGHTIRPKLGYALAVYAVIIWIGSIHLGWHYGVDGPAAMLMMLAVWRLSGRIVEALAASAEPNHSHSIVPGGLEV